MAMQTRTRWARTWSAAVVAGTLGATACERRSDNRLRTRLRLPTAATAPLILPLATLMLLLPTEASAVNGSGVEGTCDWPTTVGLVGARGLPVCSGTLIHPSLVVTSARCLLQSPQTVAFGDNAIASAAEIEIAGCVDNLEFFGDERIDLAVCQLAEPAEGIPIVPILMGCETELLSNGTPIVITGFGNSITSETLGNHGAGPKRFGELQVEVVRNDAAEVDLYDPFDGVCHGDWGGSAFVQLPDGSWRLFGAAKSIVYPQGHTLEPGTNQCGGGALSRYTLLSPLVEWIESETQLDVTPCFDSVGQWDPDDRCTPFPMDIDAVASTWSELCVGELGGEALCDDLGGESDTDSGQGGSSTSGTAEGTSSSSSTDSGPPTAGSSSGAGLEGTTGEPQPSSGSGSSSGAGDAAGTEPGCGCQTPSGPGPWSLLALVFVVLRPRRGSRDKPA